MAASGAAACGEEDFPVISSIIPRERITAQLTGAAERPTPVTTQATGRFDAEIRDTSTIGTKRDSLAQVRYQLAVTNINAVTEAHIHAGGPAVAGPVMVFLFSSGSPTASPTTGILRQADITRATAFTAPFTFDSLLTRIRNGTAYVNVHTTAFPGGEIRGQITAAP